MAPNYTWVLSAKEGVVKGVEKMPDNGNWTVFQMIWATVTTAIGGWLVRLNHRIDGKVSNKEFQRYIDGQEKLTEAHIKHVQEQTASIVRAHERIDDLKE